MRRIAAADALLALIALGLLVLGLPRLVDTALLLIVSGPAASPEAARAEAARLEGIDAWWHDPFARLRAGALRFQAAAGGGKLNAAEIKAAADDLTRGLARVPANAQGWLLLALARYQDGDADGASLALRSSMLVAPYDPALLVARIEVGLKLQPQLDGDDRQLLDEQIRMAADHQFPALVKLAQASEDPAPILAALGGDPDRAAALRAALARK